MTTPTAAENCWDLSTLYRGADDPQWRDDLLLAQQSARMFRQTFLGRIAVAQPSAETLAAALRDQETLQRRLLKAFAYAQLLFAADSGNERHKALLDQARIAWSEIAETCTFFEVELQRLPEAAFAALCGAAPLAGYRHFLEVARRHAPYTLSEAEEQVLKRKDLTGKEAFAQLFEEVTSTLSFSFRFPGESEARTATGEELLALLYHPDGRVREDAFTTFLQGHADQALVLTSCFNNLLLDHGKEVELRGYPDVMTPALLAAELDGATVERLMAVTEEHYPLAREYFALKRQLLQLPELKNSDLYAPVAATSRTFAFAEARELVLAAFAEFSPEFAAIGQAFFEERRIDVPPRPGKSPGAFCHSAHPGLSPYLLLNHTGTLRDLSTLAHELGHGVHYTLAAQQNLYHYHAPLPLAETASVFAEMLLTRQLLRRETDRSLRIASLCAKLEEIIATTFRQNVLTRFEQAAHRKRAGGLLSAEDYNELWWEENYRLFGEAVTMIPAYRWGWSYIGHFIHSRFYCFSYIVGELLTLALYQRYEVEGEPFVARYLALLRQGGSRSPQELLTPLGIDLASPTFWAEGYAQVRVLLDELRREIERD